MNNQERIQARIQRDKERRRKKRLENQLKYEDFNNIISYQNYFSALKKCQKGVMWKRQPQIFKQNALVEISKIIETMGAQAPIIPKSYRTIKIFERGKERSITPVAFQDRLTQRVICDESLMPVVQKSLIYDNGASTQGKGTNFARERMDLFLRRAIKKWGEDFYVLKYDFKSFFDSIPHSTCQKVLNDFYFDDTMPKIIMDIVHSYQKPPIIALKDVEQKNREMNRLLNNEYKGITLGSQISQILALAVPNSIDHYLKDVCGIKETARYMDDGIIIHNSKELLQKIYDYLKTLANKLGLAFNVKKTHIIKATKGFEFLKIKYRVKGNKIIKTLTRSGTVRMRRKLKKYYYRVQQGLMSLDDVYNSIQAWLSHAKLAKSYKTVKNMLKLYNELFDGYKITKKFNKCRFNTKGRYYEILQADKWAEFRWDSDKLRAA